MLKKCVLKVSNTLSTINYIRQSKSRSSTSDDDASACSCDCDYTEVNRDLFIENYLIGRGGAKMRSSSLSVADDAYREAAARRNNHRRKSLMEKREDRLKINRNFLFGEKVDTRAVSRHRIASFDDDFYEMDRGCDFIEASAPTLKKINNHLRDFADVELSRFSSFRHVVAWNFVARSLN
jgi:hypothetical protein